MLSLLRIAESYGVEGQYYDLGKDFASFRRMIDGADQKIRQQYEQAIGEKLIGKRVRARASRGYKQYVKDYEFDVAKITVDDYYDNFVIVAHDTTTPKAKEYFLKPGFKVQILGPSTGQPSPQKGDKPGDMQPRVPKPVQQQPAANADQHKPMALAPAGRTPSEEPQVKEDAEKGTGFYDAYPIDQIGQDIKSWLPKILLKPETALRDFIKGLGWQKQIAKGTTVALFDLKIPSDTVKPNIGVEMVKQMVTQMGKEGSPIQTKYDLVKMDPDDAKGEWNLRIKKTTIDTSV
jgi:hypothetical protein